MSVASLPEELDHTIDEAVDALRRGELIAYPTEGVFGIGCDPLNPDALGKVIEIKQRDAEKGLIVVARDLDQLRALIKPLDSALEQQLMSSWPGPVTWVVDARDSLPELLTGGRATLAVRVSAHPVIIALCERFGKPIVSTSANYSGQPAATNVAEVRAMPGSMISVIIDAPLGGQAGATSIIDAKTGKQLR